MYSRNGMFLIYLKSKTVEFSRQIGERKRGMCMYSTRIGTATKAHYPVPKSSVSIAIVNCRDMICCDE